MLTFAAKTAIRSVAEVMGHPDYKKLPDLIPNTPGIKLKEAYEESEELRKFAEQNPEIWRYSLKIEGSVKSYGAHAGGVIIAPSRIDRIVPLRRESTYGHPTSQFDMKWVERLLVKFDILKLATIDVIDEILEQVDLGEDFNINEINVNDPYVYETIFQTGDLSGVFQFESNAQAPLYE